MKNSIRKGEEVQVITGENKGKKGKVLAINESKVLVEGINIRKRHVKPNQQNQKGGVIQKEAPIHVSNVMLVMPNGEKSKIGRKIVDGKSKRYFKKSGELC
jgi:large subunit ribosomal protein L24